MNKRMKKKQVLNTEVEHLKSEVAVLKGELNTLSQALSVMKMLAVKISSRRTKSSKLFGKI